MGGIRAWSEPEDAGAILRTLASYSSLPVAVAAAARMGGRQWAARRGPGMSCSRGRVRRRSDRNSCSNVDEHKFAIDTRASGGELAIHDSN